VTGLFRAIASLALLVLMVFTSTIVLSAQESSEHTSEQASTASAKRSTGARTPLNEQQRRGEALFVQNCTLCHMPSNQKKKLGIQALTLEGMFGQDADTGALRQFIQQGVSGKMPAFRYGLAPNDIDDIVAYLKVGAHLKPSGGNN
jgi:mono/diheme cytochrome c family protein